MTIKITYNGRLYDEIVIEKACLGGLSLCQNQIRNDFIEDINSLKFINGYATLTKNLPNDLYIVFLIFQMSDDLYEKYKGLTALSATFNGINIKAII